MPHATAAAAATSSTRPTLHHQHTGISCDYCCGDQNLQGNRFKCQTCDNFDLCQSCFENHNHDRRHVFVLIASEGATPISLAKPHNADSQAANASREPQRYSSDVHHETFTAGFLFPAIYAACPRNAERSGRPGCHTALPYGVKHKFLVVINFVVAPEPASAPAYGICVERVGYVQHEFDGTSTLDPDTVCATKF